MYLVTWEGIEDGIWCDEPEGFDTQTEAEKYAAKSKDALLPGNCMAIYRCELIGTIEGPQVKRPVGRTGDRGSSDLPKSTTD